MTTWEAFQRFPPFYVRLLAKKPHGCLKDQAWSDAELAIRCNIPLARIRELKEMLDWESVPMGEMKRFFEGCNFDPTKGTDRNRVARYEWTTKNRKAQPFEYLRRHPKWESEFLPLIKMLKSREAA